jgi:hypothetical protein
MKLDRRLDLVIEIDHGDQGKLYVRHTPIRREVFERHFLVLTRAVAALYEQSVSPVMATRIGLLMLRDCADKLGEDVRQSVETTLLPEIWRLTNVIAPSQEGRWTPLPFEKAIAEHTIDSEEAWEVQNAVVFFTAASWVHRRTELETLVYPVLKASGSRIESSSFTDFIGSLPTSTPADNTGGTARVSSIPV